MKEAFEFVKHGVVNRQFEETLTQIHACGDYIQTYNGVVTISHPLLGIGSFSSTSTKIISAMEACGWNPDIKINERFITLKNKNVQAKLSYDPTARKDSPTVGKEKSINNIIKPLSILFPFISDDASRPWSRSVLIRKKLGYVTNNIMVARTKLKLPDMIIPAPAISVLLRIGEEPSRIVQDDKTITFFYDKEYKWVKTKVIAEQWPDIHTIFKQIIKKEVGEIGEEIKKAVAMLSPFIVDDVVLVKDGRIGNDEFSVDLGYKIQNMAFSYTVIKKVLSGFTHMDLSQYPNIIPIANFENDLVGGFMGMMT